MSAVRADGDEAAGLHRERLGARQPRVHRVDLRVEDDQVGVLAADESDLGSGGSGSDRSRGAQTGQRRAGNAHELTTVVAGDCHDGCRPVGWRAWDPESSRG